MVYKQSLSALSKTSTWTLAGNKNTNQGFEKCTGIYIHNNTVYSIQKDTLWTQDLRTMTPTSPWTQASKKGIIGIVIDGDTIWAAGSNYYIYKQTLSTMTTTSSWTQAGPNGCLDIAIHSGTLYCVGTDKNIYTQSLSTMTTASHSLWYKVPLACCISSIVIHAGKVYGSGSDFKIYSYTISVGLTGGWKGPFGPAGVNSVAAV